jgi:hypothetical protein
VALRNAPFMKMLNQEINVVVLHSSCLNSGESLLVYKFRAPIHHETSPLTSQLAE